MLRKLICLILIGLLCLPACAEQEAPSHLYHFTSAAEAPAEIADSIADLFGSDVTYIDGRPDRSSCRTHRNTFSAV